MIIKKELFTLGTDNKVDHFCIILWIWGVKSSPKYNDNIPIAQQQLLYAHK